MTLNPRLRRLRRELAGPVHYSTGFALPRCISCNKEVERTIKGGVMNTVYRSYLNRRFRRLCRLCGSPGVELLWDTHRRVWIHRGKTYGGFIGIEECGAGRPEPQNDRGLADAVGSRENPRRMRRVPHMPRIVAEPSGSVQYDSGYVKGFECARAGEPFPYLSGEMATMNEEYVKGMRQGFRDGSVEYMKLRQIGFDNPRPKIAREYEGAASKAEYHHVRIKDPAGFLRYRWIDFSRRKGIKALVGINPSGKHGKRGGRTDIQKISFRKELWNVKEINSWLQDHGYGALK